MAQSIIDFITSVFGNDLGKQIGVLFVSMLPIIELRGAIFVAYAMGISWMNAMIIAIIGNMLPIPFILLFLDYVFDFMKKHHILENLINKLEDKARNKSKDVTKYQYLGLLIFVAIPLPGTGAWTGALIASVMKMDKKQAFISIGLGVIVAAIIVTFTAYGLLDNILALF